MTVKLNQYEGVEYSYDSMYQMMQHMSYMANDGWYLTSFSRIDYHAIYKRDVA